MAVEKLSDVADAAVSEFERFGGGVKATLSFVEGREGELHGLLNGNGVWRKHGASCSKEENSFSRTPSLQPNSHAKKAKWDS
jgi:hypothetical protein